MNTIQEIKEKQVQEIVVEVLEVSINTKQTEDMVQIPSVRGMKHRPLPQMMTMILGQYRLNLLMHQIHPKLLF